MQNKTRERLYNHRFEMSCHLLVLGKNISNYFTEKYTDSLILLTYIRSIYREILKNHENIVLSF